MKFSGKTKNQDFIPWTIHSVGFKRIFNIFLENPQCWGSAHLRYFSGKSTVLGFSASSIFFWKIHSVGAKHIFNIFLENPQCWGSAHLQYFSGKSTVLGLSASSIFFNWCVLSTSCFAYY